MTVDGLQTWPSAFGPAETLERLKQAIAAAGLTLFAHIDQAAAARTVDMALPPMDLLIFGNPRAGTPLMARTPTIGIDLPLKALVWQEADGSTWLALNAPGWVGERHHLPRDLDAVTGAIARLQTDLAHKATA